MAELRNCPVCNAIFNFNGLRDVCLPCHQAEEDLFQQVYQFLRKRENRAATVERIVEVTGAEEKQLYKWVRKRRLQPAQFPGLGYPCDQCGTLITQAKLCRTCTDSIKSDLKLEESNRLFQEASKSNQQKTYLSSRKQT
ncbi:TIGR03826 family flagellar region protein [Jeotgalibacillus proteolyticus]|uniref:TIGR03826 family flagellar region protein n=1 Tax=Jeotgalibacillus proteolyticus TaxID=2082395 RepID=UPI003CF4CB66